ncbi:MAG: hypothetical protein EOO30_02590 [Comamonadaceae bacterium]|nr:MAG: hypothetical protein EOO30_02590 [Comamonadaceae bacterium]
METISPEEAVQKALGEPVFIEFPENTWKIRTNLVIISLISIAVVFGDLHIEPDSQIFGLKFRGLSDAVLTNSLIAIVVYLLAHFLWAAADSFLEWRVRITGTRLAFTTGSKWGSNHADYPDDPRQSSLYRWWTDHAPQFGVVTDHLKGFESRLATLEQQVSSAMRSTLAAEPQVQADAASIVTAIRETRDRLTHVEGSVRTAVEVVQSGRVPESLSRFDNWFAIFLRSQNLRWLVIDIGAPVLAAGYALVLLTQRM